MNEMLEPDCLRNVFGIERYLLIVQTNAARSRVRTLRATTEARVSATVLTLASAGARFIPSDRSASPVST